MCGIAGSYQCADVRRIAETMNARLAHRGPDARGVHYTRRRLGRTRHLGHRRLSIIDLSAAADQPFVKDGLVLTYNGELYNYRELRTELAGAGRAVHDGVGHRGRARGVATMGKRAAFARFRGMFAFAILDERTGHLFLARDQLGIKPLYLRAARAGCRLRLGAQGDRRGARPGAAHRRRCADREHPLLLGPRATLRDPRRREAAARLLGGVPPRR